MWHDHAVVEEDLERASGAAFVPYQELDGARVLVTGATGLIGVTLVKTLLWRAMAAAPGMHVVALVRDRAKAERVFAAPLAAGAPLSLVDGDVQTLAGLDGPVHHVVHGASVTASRDFVERPLSTIRTALVGTERVLDLAAAKGVRSFVYLSSMEVYGAPDGSSRVAESDFVGVDPMVVRNCYPESKRMAESMCAAYASELGVPARVARLTQTFGPGVSPDDGRVFAQLARSALAGQDIVLQTAGQTERSYLYTADAATAVLTVLLNGRSGEAYNAANEETFCSIRAMAELVAATCGPRPVRVRVADGAGEGLGYAQTMRMDLDTSKLRALGWQPTVGLAEMYRRMVAVT